MVEVIGVRFRTAGKIYFFNPKEFQVKSGDHVIVETARGIEFGSVVSERRQVKEKCIGDELKPVLRIATKEDEERAAKNREKEKEAYKICLDKIKEHELDMKLVSTEYTFDNNKVLFYFTADGRVDFRELVKDPDRYRKYKGSVTIDRYGRKVPKHAHGTTNLKRKTSSTMLITDAVMELYDRIVDKNLLIRRINITANKLVDESFSKEDETYEQLDLFTDYTVKKQEQAEEEAVLEREKRMQQTMLTIKKKFGKNAILKGMNLQEGATAKDRNEQIGGHKA